MAMNREKLIAFCREYRPVLLILLLGVMLMLLPAGGSTKKEDAKFSDKEEKLALVLSRIEGVGECSVLLRESGKNEKGGALVVCDGADRAQVCLAVKEAVSAYTGLGSNRIVILRTMQGGK